MIKAEKLKVDDKSCQRFGGYHTKYYTTKGSDFQVSHVLGAPCFAGIEYKFADDKPKTCNYVVILDKGNKVRKSIYNTCLLNKTEITWFLKHVSRIFHFDFTVKNSEDKKSYNIDVTISGTHLQHLFVLTCIRYLYEQPMNLCVADVVKYIKEKRYSDEVFHKENAFLLATAAFITASKYISFGHCVNTSPSKMMYKPVEELKKILNDKRLRYLNGIFLTNPFISAYENDSFIEPKYKTIDYGDDFYKVWFEEKNFKTRCKYLEYNLTLLKKVVKIL